MRRVTGRTIGVRGDGVERGERRGFVAGHAHRRCGDTAGAVRTMTRGAPPLDARVLAPFLVGMTRRTRCGASTCPRVRFVAARARLVTEEGRRLFGRVTRAARRGGLFEVNIASVTGRTVAMARVRVGELDLGRVTCRADRRLRRRREVVGAMARYTRGPVMGRGVRRCDGLMARRACRYDGGRIGPRVRLVACDAGVLVPVRGHDVGVAALT
jgi:hypothetical protein